MIPRAAHRLEAALRLERLETTLSLSRQRLPRPARLYTTPSKSARAPGLAQAPAQLPSQDYPGFLSQPPKEYTPQSRTASLGDEIGGFLHRRIPYTILPAPLPNDRSSDQNEHWYTDSRTQELLGVMDACLHNLYDVPRAKHIFEGIREKIGNPALDTRVYNAFLEAFVDSAVKDDSNRKYWVQNTWELYDVLENGREKHEPDENTYAIMLLAWYRLVLYHLLHRPLFIFLFSKVQPRIIKTRGRCRCGRPPAPPHTNHRPQTIHLTHCR